MSCHESRSGLRADILRIVLAGTLSAAAATTAMYLLIIVAAPADHGGGAGSVLLGSLLACCGSGFMAGRYLRRRLKTVRPLVGALVGGPGLPGSVLNLVLLLSVPGTEPADLADPGVITPLVVFVCLSAGATLLGAAGKTPVAARPERGFDVVPKCENR